MKTIGILSFQGGVFEHKRKLEALGKKVTYIRYPSELKDIDGIILPGGESTCITKLLDTFQLTQPLLQKIKEGFPVWGTCAGAILLAKEVDGKTNPSQLGLMNIHTIRNAYGTQLDSFIHKDNYPHISPQEVNLVFIRAPQIASHQAVIELKITKDGKEHPVALSENHLLVTTFHPELDSGLDLYQYLFEKWENAKAD